MILTCPSCETQYFADDSTIGDSGRSVKCAACTHTWHVQPEGAIPRQPAELATAGAHAAYRLRLREKRQRRSNLTAISIWLIMAILFISIVTSAVVFRNQLVNFWPESARAYKLVGLDVNRFGLDFADIDAKRTFEGTQPILIINGTVRNTSEQDQPRSDVRVGLRDERGAEITSVRTALDVDALAPGQMAQFQTRLEDPPVEAFELELSFIRTDGRAAPDPQIGPSISAADR